MKDALNLESTHEFVRKTGQPLHWYYAHGTHARNMSVSNPTLQERLQHLDSGQTNSRLGRIPPVIGMPVIISQNCDVSGGMVNGCTGKLVSGRYQLGENGKRYATLCVLEARDTTLGIIPDLPDYHVVTLHDTVNILFKHPYSGSTEGSQVPILPEFTITAHKAQGKTLPACIVRKRVSIRDDFPSNFPGRPRRLLDASFS